MKIDPPSTFGFFSMFVSIWGRGAGWGQKERETQNLKPIPGSELSAQPEAGLEVTDCEIMTPEPKWDV